MQSRSINRLDGVRLGSDLHKTHVKQASAKLDREILKTDVPLGEERTGACACFLGCLDRKMPEHERLGSLAEVLDHNRPRQLPQRLRQHALNVEKLVSQRMPHLLDR